MKNINAPQITPVKRIRVFLVKNWEDKPINKTLPHVQWVPLWYPITKSVTAKLIITIGINLNPKNTGT